MQRLCRGCEGPTTTDFSSHSDNARCFDLSICCTLLASAGPPADQSSVQSLLGRLNFAADCASFCRRNVDDVRVVVPGSLIGCRDRLTCRREPSAVEVRTVVTSMMCPHNPHGMFPCCGCGTEDVGLRMSACRSISQSSVHEQHRSSWVGRTAKHHRRCARILPQLCAMQGDGEQMVPTRTAAM